MLFQNAHWITRLESVIKNNPLKASSETKNKVIIYRFESLGLLALLDDLQIELSANFNI